MFREVFIKLYNNKIPFYITGSYAVYAYTKSVIPGDIDLIIRRSDIPNIELLFQKKFSVIKTIRNEYATLMSLHNIIEFGCFDSFIKNNKAYSFAFDLDVYKRCKIKSLMGNPVRIMPIEELITLKLVMNRDISLGEHKNDLEHVIRLLQSSYKLDMNRLLRLIAKYDVRNRFLKAYSLSLPRQVKPKEVEVSYPIN